MLILISILGCYILLIGILWIGILKVPTSHTSSHKTTTRFSIVIPFRNEVQELPNLLSSLLKIEYPKHLFEVFLIDDESSDTSVKIIQKHFENSDFPYQILKNKRVSNSPKKDAILTAINNASFEWIVTTDADCSVHKSWLKTLDSHIQQEQPIMIAAPVTFSKPKTFVEQFQFFDNLSLQGSTMGGFGWNAPFLCNGANLAYLKDAFLEVNGFTGNDTIASGDDHFLLEKLAQKHASSISYLKNTKATVITKYENSWNAIIEQRIRWTSKSKHYKKASTKAIGLLVFLMNFSLVVAFVLSLLKLVHWDVFLYLVSQKLFVDFILIFFSAMSLKKSINILHYITTGLCYPWISCWIVFKSFVGKFKWKGREFKTV